SSKESVAARVLDEVDACEQEMIGHIVDVLHVPSVSGSDAENEAQAHMAQVFADAGLDVDHWQIDLDRLTADPDFPGMEVDRHEAWGLVGRLPGSGDGATLMLNGHIDVVPIGDPEAWTTAPFGGAVDAAHLYGR